MKQVSQVLTSTRCIGIAAFLLTVPNLALAAPADLRANSRALAASARAVARGEALVVRGLGLQGLGDAATLELERFDVWRPGAVVLVDGRRAAVPDTAYFRGRVAAEPDSTALLSVRASGEVQGLVQRRGRTWLVGKGRNQRGLNSHEVTDEEIAPFECGNDIAFAPDVRLGADEAAATGSGDAGEPPVAAGAGTVLDSPFLANVAIETDYEFYARFGNTTDALDYIADLIGYSDLTYSREVDTDLQVGFVRLWTTGAANDPWTANSDTSSALTELRNYWNANMSSVDRTLVHMLSGKGLGGGIAWVGVLCNHYGNPGGSYDYGLSASLGTNFNWDGDQNHDPSNVPWDIVVVQHEIGHNFNSPHTHDYCNIGGSSLPIDNCWQGCQAGATVQLPSCSEPTPHFTSGGGSGTIMSYCHQRGGGYGNIAMTFGEGHTCGTLPGREADRMTSHVVSRSAAYPACFASTTCGNGVLDAGEQCDGADLGGATCAGEGFAGGALSCASNCTLDTSGCTNCGNGVRDSGEVCDGGDLGGATCGDQGCTGGGALACNATCSGYDESACLGCPLCNENGVCEAGEDCEGCPGDCAGGTTSGAVCGNGVCEAANGESCVTCPSDCNGVQNGKPSGRYCCGDGSGSGWIPCSDALCSAGGRTCTTTPSEPGSYCCGDGQCEAPEGCGSCGIDCASPAEECTNGVDDDCNGRVDCADDVCSALPACQCGGSGAACTSASDCCSANCRTKGKRANTCS
jgi:hypothetical protein